MISIGGLVGNNYGSISLSSAIVDIYCFLEKNFNLNNYPSKQYVGGIAGFSSGSISNSYAIGNIISNSDSSNHKLYIGGLVGYLSIFENPEAPDIDMTYAAVTISVSSPTGVTHSEIFASGLVGYQVVGHISNSFTTSEVSIHSDDSYVSDIVYHANTPSSANTWINLFRLDTQVLLGSNINDNGDTVTIDLIQNDNWIYSVLGWSQDIWTSSNSENGGYPTLK